LGNRLVPLTIVGPEDSQIPTDVLQCPVRRREIVVHHGAQVHHLEPLALLAASLVTSTKEFGLSLGDRACLALAMSRGLPVLTTESRWERVALPVDVRLIRTRSAA
jgi:hypothetical protein